MYHRYVSTVNTLRTPAALIQMHFRLDLIIETIIMSPDQAAPLVAFCLGKYCLLYRLPKKKVTLYQTTKVGTGG